jgi:hypothetical protein
MIMEIPQVNGITFSEKEKRENVLFRIYAFGEILSCNSSRKYPKKAALQVPGRLIFREYPHRMHQMG